MGKKVFFIKRHKIILVLMCIIIGYFGFLFIDQELKIKELKREENQLEEKIQAIECKIEDVEEEIDKSDTTEFIEKEAREKLKMVKENEIIYMI